MEELEICVGDSLDTVVKRLLEAKVEGKHVFCDFNGVKLYSDSITIDYAYFMIYGCTKAKWIEKLKKEEEEKQKKLEEDRKHAKVIENILNLIERGKALIYPFRYEEWAKLVEADAFGDYSGMITETAIKIMTAIEEEKPIEELIEIFKNKADTGWSAGLIRNVVMTYSKNGYPFYKATRYGKWTEEECEAILKIMQDNEEHSEDLHFANSVVESKKEVIAKRKKLVRDQKKNNYNS